MYMVTVSRAKVIMAEGIIMISCGNTWRRAAPLGVRRSGVLAGKTGNGHLGLYLLCFLLFYGSPMIEDTILIHSVSLSAATSNIWS